MSDSSFNPELNSSDEEGPSRGRNISFASLRSYGCQISIDSASEVPNPETPSTSCSQSFQFISLISPNLIKRKAKVYTVKKRCMVGVSKSKKIISRTLPSPEIFKYPEPQSEPEPLNIDKYSRPSTNIILDVKPFQTALDSLTLCSVCLKGNVKIFQTSQNGLASHLPLQCNNCSSRRTLWSVSGKYKSKLHIDNEELPSNDLLYTSVLAGRLIGVGWSKLHLFLSFLNIPGPMTSRNFLLVQDNILIAAKPVAEESMDKARDELRAIRQLDPSTKYVTAVGTFNGAYQQRSRKSGGGFSRYCFAAAIIAETGKVVSYGVAFNTCSLCNILGNRLKREQISIEEFDSRMVEYKVTCPAEYSDLVSVHLESAIAPRVITETLDRGVLFTGIVSEGDNKSHEILQKAGVYNHLDDSSLIQRFECLAHLTKRMKTNLFKRQDKVLKLVRADKAAKSRKLSRKGHSKQQIRKELDPKFRGTL